MLSIVHQVAILILVLAELILELQHSLTLSLHAHNTYKTNGQYHQKSHFFHITQNLCLFDVAKVRIVAECTKYLGYSA